MKISDSMPHMIKAEPSPSAHAGAVAHSAAKNISGTTNAQIAPANDVVQNLFLSEKNPPAIAAIPIIINGIPATSARVLPSTRALIAAATNDTIIPPRSSNAPLIMLRIPAVTGCQVRGL